MANNEVLILVGAGTVKLGNYLLGTKRTGGLAMEFKDNHAIYLQIADLFCENILLEKWNAGDRIPSVREMAVNIEVNPNTVLRTFTYLQDKGIIFNKRGIGYFVSEDGFEKTKALRKENFVNNELPRFFKAMDLLNLSLNNIKMYYDQFKADTDR